MASTIITRITRLFLLQVFFVSPSSWAITDLERITEAGHADYPSRYRLTYAIPETIPEDTRARLEKFLTQPLVPGDLSEEELAALKNNVADALIKQTGGPRSLLAQLKTLWRDEKQGLVWRSYVVQKIPELTLKLSKLSEQEEAVTLLRKMAVDDEPEFYATAIMGMDRLNQARPQLLPGDEIARASALRVNQPNAPATVRISLLQVWARHDAPSATLVAREILLKEDALILLKMSALAVLGAHGTSADNALLNRYLASPEGRLSTAAESALAALAKRK